MRRNLEKEVLVAEQLKGYEFKTMKELQKEITRLHIKNKYRLGDLGNYQPELVKGDFLEYRYYLRGMVTDVSVIPKEEGYKVCNAIMITEKVFDRATTYLNNL